MSGDELSVMIRAIRYEAEGVLSFELEPLPGNALPDFAPGAHIDVHLPNGLMRQAAMPNGRRGSGRKPNGASLSIRF